MCDGIIAHYFPLNLIDLFIINFIKKKSMLIVGISGYAHSGKDTACQLLLDSKIPLIKQKFAFADALRDFASTLNVYFPEIGLRYNEVIAQYGYETAKTKFPCVREHLIAVGHGARTCIKESIWIDAVEHKLRHSTVQIALISDVRYLNEVDFILRNGGIAIYLRRPQVGPVNDTEANSIKEILATDAVKIINNDGALINLETQLLEIIQDYTETTLIP
jgi:hypothetical protein